MNQPNRPQKQMQDQMRAQREQQMKQAAYLDQRAKQQNDADLPDSVPQTSPSPANRKAGRPFLTFVLIIPWLAALCGGIGYTIGKSMLDSETGVIGAALGILISFAAAGVVTGMIARR